MIEVESAGYKFRFSGHVFGLTAWGAPQQAFLCDLCGTVVLDAVRHARWHVAEGLVSMKSMEGYGAA